MIDDTFYDKDACAVHAIPVIAMSELDGTERWFPSLACASDSLNIDKSGISRCLHGKQYQSGGYKFRYADKPPIDRFYRKPVIATNLDDGSERFFQSVRMAGEELGVHSTYISRAISGGKNYIPNYNFRYATEKDIC